MLSLGHLFLLGGGHKMSYHEVVHPFHGPLTNSLSPLELSEFSFGCLMLFLGYIVVLTERGAGREEYKPSYLV